MADASGKPGTEPYVLQVKRIGNSLGLILPKDLMQRLRLVEGDALHVIEEGGGTFRLTPNDPNFERGMDAARKAMGRYRNALTELAK